MGTKFCLSPGTVLSSGHALRHMCIGGIKAKSPLLAMSFPPCLAADHCGPLLATCFSFREHQELAA